MSNNNLSDSIQELLKKQHLLSAKEILKTDSDGSCRSKGRIFSEDSNYAFDATETEPPNTNAFFGSGGTAIWVADTSKPKIRGCIELVVGVAPDVLKCVEMTVGN